MKGLKRNAWRAVSAKRQKGGRAEGRRGWIQVKLAID